MDNKPLAKSGFELDAISELGKNLCCMKRPGVRKSAKRSMNRRMRHQIKQELTEIY